MTTDNITPLVPQTKVPMTTDEIIRRLREVKAIYKAQTTGMFTADTVGGDMDAMDAAIRAVTALEEVRRLTADRCITCKHNFNPPHTGERPCKTCTLSDTNWEWRWPLGEEADHETN